ncbi:MAG: helix-turn-helix domain-containing protein [Spirochaetia bacterium]
MKYNLLIVDDEIQIVDWLADLFSDVPEIDMDIFRAYNAKEALDWMYRTKIDVVLSDIRMPGMSGLKLLEEIKSEWPQAKVVFLTGHQEFDYVYKAIKNQGVRYLLKLEEDEVIIQEVLEAVKEIEEELNNRKLVEEAQSQIKNALPVIRRKFLYDLFTGIKPVTGISQEEFDELGIPIDIARPFFLFIGYLDESSTDKVRRRRNILLYSLETLGQRFLPGRSRYINAEFKRNGMIWLFQYDSDYIEEDRNLNRLKGAFEYIQTSLKKSVGETVSFFLINSPVTILEIQQKYEEVNHLIGCRLGLCTEMIITEQNLFARQEDDGELGEVRTSFEKLGQVNLLENMLDTGDRDNFRQHLGSLLEPLAQVKRWDNPYAQEIYLSISLIYLRYINRWNLKKKLESKIMGNLTDLHTHSSWDDAVRFLHELGDKIFTFQSEQEQEQSGAIILKLREYIDTNLGEDLSLVRLADIVHMNPSYLSRFFKYVTSTNLSTYIADRRLDRAKELLQRNDLKIKEIGEEVGYLSSHSFTRFFKKAFGVSPQEYRDQYNLNTMD